MTVLATLKKVYLKKHVHLSVRYILNIIGALHHCQTALSFGTTLS